MSRTLISETPTLIGQTVTIKGWIVSVRSHGNISFADVRDRSGIIQVVGGTDLGSLHPEYAVEIEGSIVSRNPRYFNPKLITGEIELQSTSVKTLSASRDLPFDLHSPSLEVSLPVLLDQRGASLRTQKAQDTFRVQSTISTAFRQFCLDNGFTEIHVPTIIPAASEGGSQVFEVKYFDYKAFLAQSPQLYKQILVGSLERVFTLSHAYRAEPSVTTRHLTEYVGMDLEMGFIDSWLDVVAMADRTMKFIFSQIEKEHGSVLSKYGLSIPKTIEKTPIIKLTEALDIVSKRTNRDVRNELDLDPESEREICRWAQEEHGSDMVFVTHFYTKKRAWYSQVDPENPEFTLSFDLIGRGVEWISGSQRINDYDQVLNKIIAMGADPKEFELYLQAFRYGMPPEGGFCIGLERVTQNVLSLANVREASLFPRDMERIDGRLSQIGRKINPKATANAKS